jgi:tetratricopeptide (TPR) repeat protein
MSIPYESYTEFDWFAEAKSFESKREFDKALMAYDEAIKIDPEFAKAWFYKAILLYKLGKMDKALECAKRAAELKPEWKKHITKDMPNLKL